MKNLFFVISVAVVLAGCANRPQPASARNISFPATNEVVVAEVGEKMMSQGKMLVSSGIEILSTGKACNFMFECWELRAGEVLKRVQSRTPKYCGKAYSASVLVTDAELCVTVKNGILDGTRVPNLSWDDVKFRVGEVEEVNQSSFQQTLYYQGKSKNEVYFEYREFSGNLARPAFNQSVTFDLEEGKTVGFKGARIEILETSNLQIKYKVTSHFPPIY